MGPKLERLLIAVDSGPSSNAAVDEGIALAAEDGAEVAFVHVVPVAGEQFVARRAWIDRAPERARTRVLVDAAQRADAAGVPCRTELLVGYPPKEIAALADDLDVDLVVVGARHMTALRRLLAGSTSRALLSETDRPVLVVPESAPKPALT
jgi:nucleotide-binding universal stress UspA family protein